MQNLSQQINRKRVLEQRMDDILQRARVHGATDAAVSVNHDQGFGVDARMGQVETVAFSEEKGIAVTVYIGQQKGSATSSDTSDAALDAMVTAAYDIAKVSAKDPCFGLPDVDLINMYYPALDLLHPWSITPEAAGELAVVCEAKALGVDKRIHNSDGVSISTYTFCHGYANTRGFTGIIDGSRHSLSCSLLAEEASGMQRDYAYTTARKASDLMNSDDLAVLAANRTIARLSPKQLETQKVPVLFSARVASGLIGSFIQAVSGSSLYRKHSFLLDSLGQAIFPDNINIFEAPHLLGALGSSPFDGEGIITRPNVLIKDGVLQQYVLGSYSARKLGLKTTANSSGVHNLTVEPTAGDLNNLLQTMNRGLLVTELMGQGVNAMTGDYSRGASGFWVEDGKIQYPVDGVTVAGNLKEMFQRIIGVGTDRDPSNATRCGSILIEEMMVAGS
ncbi:MAG: metalloprotease PmbA [Gammaproteobacteria bacterium]|nr:metalloprotease PmbA [Gammaproteobacteria bacterium]MCH9762618.1 metalloprotease PmbA [Gammaproteobacteria bacterium]